MCSCVKITILGWFVFYFIFFILEISFKDAVSYKPKNTVNPANVEGRGGGGGLVASVEGIPAQIPEFKCPDRLITFLQNNHGQRSTTCCHNTILDGTAKLYASRSFHRQHEALNKKTKYHYKNLNLP